MKNKMTALLALTLVSSLGATSAFATMPDKNDRPDFQVKGNYKFAVKFNDVSKDDWALRFITEMNSKGVINGYGDGKFQPSNNVSHEEAIVMTVRAMGLADEANALAKDITLDLTDAATVSDWAKPYISIAIEKGFLDAKTALSPQASADREWTTELVVRAMGLNEEAKAHMQDTLNFNDAKEIDADAVGYIAVAADKKIISGYTDHTFQPHKPVKRNELAVILCNAEHLFEYDTDRQHQTQGQLQGSLKTVSATELTFTTSTKQEVTYKIASQSYVFLGNQISQWSDLKPNMWVRVLLNQTGEIVFAQAKAVTPDPVEIESYASGKVIAYTAPTPNAAGSIAIVKDKDREKKSNRVLTLPVAKDVKILLNGELGKTTTFKADDNVRLIVIDNTVIQINVMKSGSKYDDKLSPETPVK
ncbi:S-layer homology domain-containing protein [Tumebacillus permanentifrigoris]|uniref:S-layer family protein n=1 Tax=Tumebacillus permanentifrigoris TaxID=378543 RepID=A0A316DA73_9BACL|nr:S-layer homology domain-containing protein [Tumebacillus permanentifrigoris]PWK14395.1 S-layer family protein [Tumebacillus permanentifrigoris]